MLKTTGLQAQDIQLLLQLRGTIKSLDSNSIRIDLAPYSHVHWLNNLEKVSCAETTALNCSSAFCQGYKPNAVAVVLWSSGSPGQCVDDAACTLLCCQSCRQMTVLVVTK